MNKERVLLLAARGIIEDGSERFICLALELVAGYGQCPAAVALVRRIERELTDYSGDSPFSPTLDSWLEGQGICATQNQLRLARLAWIDKLLEAYP